MGTLKGRIHGEFPFLLLYEFYGKREMLDASKGKVVSGSSLAESPKFMVVSWLSVCSNFRGCSINQIMHN